MSIHILVLNYNGRALLEECLPSVCRAAEYSPVPCRVSVLDNASGDDSREWLAKNLPQAAWIACPENRFLFSFNPAVAALKEDTVLILNNDIKVEPDFIAPLWRALREHKDAFFASPKHLDFEGAYNGGRNVWGLRLSLPWSGPNYPGNLEASKKAGYTLFTGNGLFWRDKYLALGGFDELFWPMCWEDTDLGMRGWKQGLTGIYVPESVIYHKSGATLKKAMDAHRRTALAMRNGFLFFYSNVSSPWLWIWMVLMLPLTMSACLATGRLAQVEGFFNSLARLPLALRNRSRRPRTKFSDGQIKRMIRMDF